MNENKRRYWRLSHLSRVAKHLLDSGAPEYYILRSVLGQEGFLFDEKVKAFDVGHFDISSYGRIKEQVEFFLSLVDLVAKFFNTRTVQQYSNALSAVVILLEWVYDLMQYRDSVRQLIGTPSDDLTRQWLDVPYGHEKAINRPGRPTGRDSRGRFVSNQPK